MDKILGGLLLILGAIALFVLLSLLFAIPTMILWNWLVPILFLKPFVISQITLVQAWGINLFTGCLFRGFSGSSSSKKD